jgi:hypothetical protein
LINGRVRNESGGAETVGVVVVPIGSDGGPLGCFDASAAISCRGKRSVGKLEWAPFRRIALNAWSRGRLRSWERRADFNPKLTVHRIEYPRDLLGRVSMIRLAAVLLFVIYSVGSIH